MKKPFSFLLLVLIGLLAFNKAGAQETIARPKLVVGIVIDQMRWDYLYRYYDIYKQDGGFKRLLGKGFSCENTLIPYTPTYTAPGHTCIYTGSVPAIHGITGNEWYDYEKQGFMYCAQDDTVHTIGADNDNGKMSPRNMLATTITDELRLATNFRSKVIGVAIKDRGAILPAGHAANAAYWYDARTGNFISSNYYKFNNDALPKWVNAFNNRSIVDSLYKLNWNFALPEATYKLYCTDDDRDYEGKPFGAIQKKMPYDFSAFIGKDYGKISVTPYGNTLTTEMAKAAINGEDLGNRGITDFLAVSYSSPDYIGHTFGPNSHEQLDDFARLDDELGRLFSFLDNKIGEGQYLVFLTADHGVAHVAGFNKEKRLPGRTVFFSINAMNSFLKQKFDADSLVIAFENGQIYLNRRLIQNNNLSMEDIKESLIPFISYDAAVANVFDVTEISEATLNNTQKQMIANGYFPKRSGDIHVIFKPGFYEGGSAGTTHGLWNPYDAHIPLLWYGWGIKQGKTNRETYMTDIAATLAGMLHIQMPSGCVGKVITEVAGN